MVVKSKKFVVGNHVVNVELKKGKYLWQVLVDGAVWTETANELFAVCEFNSI